MAEQSFSHLNRHLLHAQKYHELPLHDVEIYEEMLVEHGKKEKKFESKGFGCS